MRKYFVLLFLLVCKTASSQDFCSTTRKLIEAAAINFKNYLDPGKMKDGPYSISYPSPVTYIQGEQTYISVGKKDKHRQFRQWVSKKPDLENFVRQMSECLAVDDPNNWKVTTSNNSQTIYTNLKNAVAIFITKERGGIEIAIDKSEPPMTWAKSYKKIPYLLMTGSSDYIFVDSASMHKTGFDVFDFGNLEGYPGESGIYSIFDKYNITSYVFFDKTGYMRGPSNGIARPFNEEFAWVLKMENDLLYFFIDKTNKPIIPPTYNDAYGFEQGIAAVMKNDKWGYIDKTGKVVIPLIYEVVNSFYNGFSWVKKGGKWGFINKEGKEIIIPKYDSIYYYDGNLCSVYFNKKWGLVDNAGNEVVPAKFSTPIMVSDGMGVFSINKLFGVIDRTGKQIVPPKYQELGLFYEGLAAFKKNGKRGYIDMTGKEVIPPQYEAANFFNDGLASVSFKGKFGFIDKTGKIIIPFIYESVDIWHEGLLAAKQNGKYGFIDKKGQVVIPFKYDFAGGFSSGLASVKLNNAEPRFFIDRAGREYRQK